MRTYSIIKAVLKAAFTSCVILEDHKYVNTVVPVGELLYAQPYAMRAPEVFLGEPCTGPSQVWAVAAMLLCWIKPGLLGAWGSPIYLINEAWSMAKILRLFPHWKIPTLELVKYDTRQALVDSAQSLSKEVPALQKIEPFDKETKKVVPQQLRDLLRFILVPDPTQRPTASSVLASKEFRDFERYVSV
ncbi:unnamed protein product [Penicillium viridicatum]